MHFVRCVDCDEDDIVFSMTRTPRGYVCKDNCLATYERAGVPVRIYAPDATPEQIVKARADVLDAFKQIGKPREVAAVLNDPKTAERINAVFREADATVGAGVNGKSYTRQVAESVAKDARRAREIREAEEALNARKAQDAPVSPLEREYGFTGPEDGSEQRYAERISRMSRARHAFWWLVHNNVAHPLIGMFPRSATFRFHDWTSRKLHGL